MSWLPSAEALAVFDFLPEDTGKFEVISRCSRCHSLQVVANQKLSSDQWDQLISWMQQKQNLEAIPAQERKVIVEYLGKHFSFATQDPMDGIGPRNANPLP